MKAALIHSYGNPDVLEIQSELPIPEPLEDEVLVRVQAAAVNPIDWKLRKGSLKLVSGFSFPKILGFDFAGIVAGIGNRIEHFRVGDQVFGMLQSLSQGSYAQFTVAKQNILVNMPKNLSFEECAAIPLAGLTAFQGLSLGGITQEKKVLILGASGGVGTLAIQIAKAYDCLVVATGGTQNQILMHKLGADRTLDYTTQSLQELEGGFDIIFDVSAKNTFSECRNLLSKQGVYITSVPTFDNLMSFALSPFRAQKCRTFKTKASYRDLLILKKMLENGSLKPVIDRVYPLDKIREAHRYSETGHAQGKIVISIPD